MRRPIFLAVTAALMAGDVSAGPSPDAVVRTLAAQDATVAAVGERLQVAARPWCDAPGWASGLTLHTLSHYAPAYRDAARRVLGLDARPTVTALVPDGAAARAGVRTGDHILSVDGAPMTVSPETGPATTADTDRALDGIDAALADGVAMLDIERDGVRRSVRLEGRPACRVRFEVRPGSASNASADGLRVQISSDLVDPARADEQVAPLVAHELAHIVLRHPERLDRHFRGLLPGFGKGGAAIRASELAADRLSVYILARAGYDPAVAATFWEAFGRAKDPGILSDRTHPGWKTRVAAIRREIAVVAAQRAAGAAITPPPDLWPVR